jgi:5S rRNA maturation endonuclease (ribonuclease M5)
MDKSGFIRLMEPVARRLWGPPNAALSNRKELRWGTHGSRVVDLKKGVWYDHETNEGGGNFDLIERETGRTKADAITWLETERLIDKQQTNGGDLGSIVATYDYVDETGKLLFQVVRYEPKDKPKEFRQRRPDGNGGWFWKLGKTRRVLYQLPELIKAVADDRPICVVEGEKDVESLRRLGIAATTNPGGSGKWRQTYNVSFHDASVILIPDNDEAGRSHVKKIATSLRGTARSICLLDLAEHWPTEGDAPVKADISHWLTVGGTADTLRELIAQAKSWKPTSGSDADQKAERGKPGNIEDDTALAFAAKHASGFSYVAIWNRWMLWAGDYWQH